MRREINANEERKFKKRDRRVSSQQRMIERRGKMAKPDRPLRVTPSAAPV